jgi:hypothetical protein
MNSSELFSSHFIDAKSKCLSFYYNLHILTLLTHLYSQRYLWNESFLAVYQKIHVEKDVAIFFFPDEGVQIGPFVNQHTTNC